MRSFALREPWTLPKFMHHTMSYVAGKTARFSQITKHHGKTATTTRAIKTAKQFRFVTYYIEQNPVVKGLVEKPDEWVASSANQKSW